MDEASKGLLRRWLTAVADGTHEEVAAEIFHASYDYKMDPAKSGPDGIVAFANESRRMSPDLQFRFLHEISEGDWATTIFQQYGTQQAEWGGIEPRGQSYVVTVASHWRVENGQIVEEYEIYDSGALAARLRGDGD